MWQFLSLGLLAELTVNGILFGAMYGVAAVGLSLIFGTMRIIFIAQGTIIILGAYLVYWLFTLGGIDPYLSLLLVVPAAFIAGAGVYQALFRKAAAISDKNTSLLIAVGLMFLVQNTMSYAWTPNPKSIVTGYTALGVEILNMRLSFTRLMSMVIAFAATGAVVVFLRRTLVGKAVRAASENMQAAMLMGIDPHRVNAIAFAIGFALAGAAGVALATTYPFDPYFGFVFALKALIALALGGIGNVVGALVGGLALGLIESYSAFFISGGWADAISYGVFLLVLMFRPEGLFVRSIKKA
ncbi:MAG: branched-chain amino acid ABC transporter permease [Rhodobiaceae bacterium]|nr:branched-chain amino acid ABC transporter permease [Rhodobiaceae bacterium]